MNCFRKICFFFFILAFIISTTTVTYTANTLYNIQINPLNRLILFFDEIPKNITSQLNNTKTQIVITLKDVVSRAKPDSLVGEGIISKISIRKIQTNLELSISLKSQRGYTISPLEYSRALMVEVFDWNSLSVANDNYRMGQLALAENLSSARAYFEKAFNENIANAGYFLGVLFLKANKIQKAREILSKAQTLGTDIADNFAALAQVYHIMGDNNKFQEFRKKFINNTFSLSYSPIGIDTTLGDSIFKEVNDFFAFYDTQSKDTSIISQEKSPTEEKQNNSILNNNKQKVASSISLFEKILIFLVATVLLMSVMLATLYLKWKRQRANQLKEKFSSEFQNEQQKIRDIATFATKMYQNAEATKAETTHQNVDSPNQINQHIKQLAEEILASKQKIEIKEKDQVSIQAQPSSKQKISPRVELAMQIQREQEELIKRKLQQLETSQLETSTERLLEISKKYGLSISSLYAKKNIEAIAKDKSIIEKLRSKFSSKKQ